MNPELTPCSGNLSTRSLTPVVDPSLLIQDSEHLETHLVAVPSPLVKEFLKSYETIAPMVVPRSATKVTSDDEFTLFAVTGFKKHGQEFIHKCRERKWTPRDYKYVEGGKEEEKKEVERVGRDERKVWGEALRLGRTGWSESVMAWIHVLALRVFVETVLRYGLPLEFVCGLITVSVAHAQLLHMFGLDCATTFSSMCDRLLTDWYNLPDDTQARQESQGFPRLGVFVSRRQCLWSRQEGPSD